MRMLRWTFLAGVMLLAVGPATAQRYDPRYPVCIQVWEWGGSSNIVCGYTSMEQCRMTAAGLSATCYPNPTWSQARQASPADRRRSRVY